MNKPVSGFDALGLTLEPLTPTMGAEIGGLDLSRPVSDAVLAALRRALLDWKVIFFRDQDITTDQHLDFARRFGELEVHPFAPHKPGYPEVLAITHDRASRGRENTWHSDVTWREIPSLGSILHALEVPRVGGDTLFADMAAAYAGLAEPIRAEIEGLKAVHDFAPFRRALRKAGKSEA
ncbi:MAG: TauD/TfdA family dioxygenase, partial [Caulobacteraceae bacterium]|nr:TauD/TfdA family dioxygenase [Caulobacteraceae bacterium]